MTDFNVEELKKKLAQFAEDSRSLQEIKVMVSAAAEKGAPILLCHPDDFELIKKRIPPKPEPKWPFAAGGDSGVSINKPIFIDLIEFQQQPTPVTCVSACIAMVLGIPVEQVVSDYHHTYFDAGDEKVHPDEYLVNKGVPAEL